MRDRQFVENVAMGRGEWLAGQSRTFAALRGKRVDKWVGVEMALREDLAGTIPQFADLEVPCLQLYWVQAWMDQGSTVKIGTYSGRRWLRPLRQPVGQVARRRPGNGIYRWRSLALVAGELEETPRVDCCSNGSTNQSSSSLILLLSCVPPGPWRDRCAASESGSV
ncbi:hypothetical protein ABTX61_34655 [Amycolatopsis japonica]|uniref:hypothetical protein n=1 Tax=Amycolatopsis japonica TaxID=208439 RepID=UPI00332703F8